MEGKGGAICTRAATIREKKKKKRKEEGERERKYSDIPARLTHLVPARVLPARRVSRYLPCPATPAFACTSVHARTQTHARVRWAHIPPPEYLVPGYRRREDHQLVPSSSLYLSRCYAPPRRTGRAIRPRLSHRYSRGLLGARGKMRQVVVRSRSPGTREIRLLLSPSPLLPPFGSAIHSCGYIICACVGHVCEQRAARPLGPLGALWALRGRGRYIIFAPMTEAQDQLTNTP